MKFSRSKKAKMRYYAQRKINRACKDIIGYYIDFENGYEVKDQAKINGNTYLLVQVENAQYAIYKIVRIGEYVRISAKKVLRNQEKFSNHEYWEEHSKIQFAEDGKIKSVKKVVRCVTKINNEYVYTDVVKEQ